MEKYKLFDHTADLGVEISGKTLEELFVHATFALFDLITNLQNVKVAQVRKIVVEGTDLEDLLVNYLREVLYLWNGEGLLLSDYEIMELNSCYLVGEVRGEPFDPGRHRINVEIKAVTHHQALVRETETGWIGRVVFDV
jgi:SHS2 domain-containing protein